MLDEMVGWMAMRSTHTYVSAYFVWYFGMYDIVYGIYVCMYIYYLYVGYTHKLPCFGPK